MSTVQKLATEQAWLERAEQGLPGRLHRRTPALQAMKLRKSGSIDERQYLAGLDAQTAYLAREGQSVRVYDRVDCGNGTEAAAAHRLDGGKLWFGFVQAVTTRAGSMGPRCLEALCMDMEMPEVARHCGFVRVQYGRERAYNQPAEALVHRTLTALADHLDDCQISGLTPMTNHPTR